MGCYCILRLKPTPKVPNVKKNLAMAYNAKKKPMSCPNCMPGAKCMAHGGSVGNQPTESEYNTEHKPLPGMEISRDVLPKQANKSRNMDKQKYAEGGAVDAMSPLKEHPAHESEDNEKQHPDREASPKLDPVPEGMDSSDASDMVQDLPHLSKSLSLAAEVMMDRKRRMLAKGGSVGSLDGPIDEPTMSDLDNDSDEMSANPEDGRQSRGLNLEPVHVMSDSEHDQSDASDQSDYKENDDSLIGEILRDRKMRRRGK